MATKRRRSDTLASIVVGHGYVKHINIVRGNIKASRNTSTLTERAPSNVIVELDGLQQQQQQQPAGR